MSDDGDRRLGLGILSAARIARKMVRGILKNTKGLGMILPSLFVALLSLLHSLTSCQLHIQVWCCKQGNPGTLPHRAAALTIMPLVASWGLVMHVVASRYR